MRSHEGSRPWQFKSSTGFGDKNGGREKESECARYLWMVSDMGKIEATTQLAEIYQSVKIVDGDDEESRRLFGIATG